jgi:hypothetical protein
MARNTLITLLLLVFSTLLAIALFAAGAIWRGRTTARPATNSSPSFVGVQKGPGLQRVRVAIDK